VRTLTPSSLSISALCLVFGWEGCAFVFVRDLAIFAPCFERNTHIQHRCLKHVRTLSLVSL
jgi:hypothetical protein